MRSASPRTSHPKKRPGPLRGTIRVPGDKSITHRAFLFASLAKGNTKIRTNSLGRDNLASLRAMRALGVSIHGSVPRSLLEFAAEEGWHDVQANDSAEITAVVEGRGFDGLVQPLGVIDCGNSGTSARLLCGLLAACAFTTKLDGDASLRKRPFKRVSEPLTKMGARFTSDTLPLEISGGDLNGIDFKSPIASAQVKSAILIAGLKAKGVVRVTEPRLSRDHTETMLRGFGVNVRTEEAQNGVVSISLPEKAESRILKAGSEIVIPGDFSSAAFFLAAGSIVEGSDIVIENVCCNPTRTGLMQLLQRMGAQIEIINPRTVSGEFVGDVCVRYSDLKGIEVTASDVLPAIDEIPVFCVAAALSDGVTVISGAEELRVKESDRLAMMAQLLNGFGCKVEERPDGLRIEGRPDLKKHGQGKGTTNAEQSTFWAKSLDHRILMCAAVLRYALGLFPAEVAIDGGVEGEKVIETSFPTFLECFSSLSTES